VKKNITNDDIIYQMTTKYNNWPTLSLLRPSKINPNCDLWFANFPSGNPGREQDTFLLLKFVFIQRSSAAAKL
jgi:hypothetical protein